jgi:hypothetical protein
MNTRRMFVPVLLSLLLVTSLLGCRATQSESEDVPWADFASEVAREMGMNEDPLFDAFQKAFDEGVSAPTDRSRLPYPTEDDMDRYIEWYQSRPEDCGPGPLGTVQCSGATMHFTFLGLDAVTDGLASQVASILGTAEYDVLTAFHQVNKTSHEEFHRKGLARLVDDGCITVEEVDRYFEWYLARPEGVSAGRVSCEQ